MLAKGLGILIILVSTFVFAVPSDDIANLLQTQENAWNRGDLEAYMEGYWRSEKMRFVSNDHVRYGWQTTLKAYQKHYPNKATLGTLAFKVNEIKMLSNHAALVVGRWQLTRQKDQPHGIFTLLVERIDDKWVITHDHSSD